MACIDQMKYKVLSDSCRLFELDFEKQNGLWSHCTLTENATMWHATGSSYKKWNVEDVFQWMMSLASLPLTCSAGV